MNPRAMNPARQSKCLTMRPARGVREMVPKLTPIVASPIAVPRLRMNHFPTDELTVTTPSPAEPIPSSRP